VEEKVTLHSSSMSIVSIVNPLIQVEESIMKYMEMRMVCQIVSFLIAMHHFAVDFAFIIQVGKNRENSFPSVIFIKTLLLAMDMAVMFTSMD
jgi:hypothetical protein